MAEVLHGTITKVTNGPTPYVARDALNKELGFCKTVAEGRNLIQQMTASNRFLKIRKQPLVSRVEHYVVFIEG